MCFLRGTNLDAIWKKFRLGDSAGEGQQEFNRSTDLKLINQVNEYIPFISFHRIINLSAC
jgi:hypothetical protein